MEKMEMFKEEYKKLCKKYGFCIGVIHNIDLPSYPADCLCIVSITPEQVEPYMSCLEFVFCMKSKFITI